MYILSSDAANYELLLPTDVSELKKEYFEELLKDIEPAPHYCIVALCYKEKLFNLVNGMKRGDGTSQVIPIAVKFNEEDNDCFIKPMDVILTDRSSIERSNHIYTNNNAISPAAVFNYIDSDKELAKAIITGKHTNSMIGGSPECIFVEFKLMPLSDIHGKANLDDNSIVNPFMKAKSDIN